MLKSSDDSYRLLWATTHTCAGSHPHDVQDHTITQHSRRAFRPPRHICVSRGGDLPRGTRQTPRQTHVTHDVRCTRFHHALWVCLAFWRIFRWSQLSRSVLTFCLAVFDDHLCAPSNSPMSSAVAFGPPCVVYSIFPPFSRHFQGLCINSTLTGAVGVFSLILFSGIVPAPACVLVILTLSRRPSVHPSRYIRYKQ